VNTIRRIRYLAGILAASCRARLVVAAASPAVAATGTAPHDGPSVPSAPVPAQTRTPVIGGTPGGQLLRRGGLP